MTATVVLVTLLLAPAASGNAAAPAACQAFTRSGAALPALVSEWFARSTDERVLLCPPAGAGSEGATALYFGEGALTQRGTVCTYPSHGLTLVGSGSAARLQRYDRSEALAMALAAGPRCPTPHDPVSAQGYIETYDISTSTFVGIMRLWSSVTNTNAVNASGSAGARGAAAIARLQAELGTRTGETTVTRIVRIPGSVLRHRYALFLKVPQPQGGGASQYVIYVDKSIRGPYEVTAFAETN